MSNVKPHHCVTPQKFRQQIELRHESFTEFCAGPGCDRALRYSATGPRTKLRVTSVILTSLVDAVFAGRQPCGLLRADRPVEG